MVQNVHLHGKQINSLKVSAEFLNQNNPVLL